MTTSNSQYKCVVLVHGFREKLPRRVFRPKRSHHKYSKAFAKWARGVSAPSGKSPGVDLMIWSFKMAHLLTGRDRIQTLAQKLDMKLQAKFDSHLPDDPSNEKSDQRAGNASLVFVAHGAGAWVVRQLFGSCLSINYRPYVCGVVFVDALQLPDTALTSADTDHYMKYLSDLTQTFKLNSLAQKNLEQLIGEMQVTDEKSIKALQIRSRLNEMESARLSHEKLWLLTQGSKSKACDKNEIAQRLSFIKNEVDDMLQTTTKTGTCAPPATETPPLEKQNQHGPLSSDSPPTASANSRSYRAESPYSESLPSIDSIEKPRKPARDASPVVSSRRGSEIWLNQQETTPVSIQEVELNAMSIAQRGMLRDSEALLSGFLNTETWKETAFEDRMRVRLTICVLQLQQGLLSAAKKGFDYIKTEIELHAAVADRSKLLGLQVTYKVWNSVLLATRGYHDAAIVDLEGLMASASESALLKSDVLLRLQLHITLAICYAFTGIHRGSDDQIRQAETIYLHQVNQAERETTSAILLMDNKANYWSARTRISILRGDYESALDFCQKALKIASLECGSRHFQTLELASLEGQLFAILDSPAKAEETCSKTLRLIVKELTFEHPLALETTGHVVDALLALSRNIEAEDTIKSLYKVCQSILGDMHPSTLRSLHQLCRLNLATGRYETAYRDLTGLLQVSTSTIKADITSTLKLQSDLAEVCYKLGKTQEAMENAKAVLEHYAQMYQVLVGSNPRRMSLNFWYAVWESKRKENPDIRVHPDVLTSLEVLATIERLESKSVGTVENVMELVDHERLESKSVDTVENVMEFVNRERLSLFGEKNVHFLESQYQLAVYYRSRNRLQEAADLFKKVWEQRKELLSPTNPQTLSAEREFIITAAAQGESALPPELTSAGIDLSAVKIAGLHEWQLGELHPETLKSLLWVFTVQTVLSADSPEALNTLSTIRGRLGEKSVQKERLLMSANMEHSLGCIYYQQKMPREALGIWKKLASRIASSASLGDKGMEAGLQPLVRRISNDIQLLGK